MTHAIKVLRLFLHLPSRERRAIGYLSRYGDILRLSFDDDYVRDAARPLLSLAYRGATEDDTRAILSAARDERVARSDGHCPVYFQNLLPEGHNRARLARARGCSEDDEFELLAAAGHDLLGAVEVAPVPPEQGTPDAILLWHTTLGLAPAPQRAVETPVEDAASLPGLVTKFSAIKDGRRYVVRRNGAAGSYLIKLPSVAHPDLVDNELTGYRLAASLGLRCAEAERVARTDVALPEAVEFPHVLVVKRFDRGDAGLRIHMEELSQALQYPPRQKYGVGLVQDGARVLRLLDQLSGDPVGDVTEFVRRLVAFALMGNTDAHWKNWALLYPDGRTPSLAPIYDPVCVAAWFAELPPPRYAVNRAVDAILRRFDHDALEALLKAAGILRPGRILKIARETVAEARARWPQILADAPDNLRASVEERLSGGVALSRHA